MFSEIFYFVLKYFFKSPTNFYFWQNTFGMKFFFPLNLFICFQIIYIFRWNNICNKICRDRSHRAPGTSSQRYACSAAGWARRPLHALLCFQLVQETWKNVTALIFAQKNKAGHHRVHMSLFGDRTSAKNLLVPKKIWIIYIGIELMTVKIIFFTKVIWPFNHCLTYGVAFNLLIWR